MTNDATLEKEDSHAGKVLLRHWYERNKHIFPASRWEPYDPTKTYAKYTISDKHKKKKWFSDQWNLCLFIIKNQSIIVSVWPESISHHITDLSCSIQFYYLL